MDKITCKNCQQEKDVSDFYADSRLKSGYKHICKVCANARSAAWSKSHPEQRRMSTQRWRSRHPEKVKAANRKPRKRIYEPEKNRVWREKRLTRTGYRERENFLANERAKKIRAWLNAYKLEHGCIDCGYRGHFAALEFDHIEGEKSFNVCNAKSIAQAQKEIKKCVVRCAICHAIRTWERLQRDPPSELPRTSA